MAGTSLRYSSKRAGSVTFTSAITYPGIWFTSRVLGLGLWLRAPDGVGNGRGVLLWLEGGGVKGVGEWLSDIAYCLSMWRAQCFPDLWVMLTW